MGPISTISSWASLRPVDFSGKLKKGKDTSHPAPDDPGIVGDTRGLVYPIFGIPNDDSAESKGKQQTFLAKVLAAATDVANEMGAGKPVDRIRPINPRELMERLPEFADRLAAKLDKRQAPMLHPELNPEIKLENVYKLTYALEHIPGLRMLLGQDRPDKRLRRFYSMGAVQLASGKTSALDAFLSLFRPKSVTPKTAFDGVWLNPSDAKTSESTI